MNKIFWIAYVQFSNDEHFQESRMLISAFLRLIVIIFSSFNNRV